MRTGKTKAGRHWFTSEERLFHELSSSSDFYIPARLVGILERKIIQNINLRNYLSSLLAQLRATGDLEALPSGSGPKTKNQEEGQKLVRFQFRPFSKDWTELMIIARSRNFSAALIFVKLLELDLERPEEPGASIFDEESFFIGQSGFRIKFLQTLDLRLGWRRRFLRYRRDPDN